MRKFPWVTGLFTASFVTLFLVLGSGGVNVASGDIITGCLKIKGNSGRLRRFAEGEDPTKPCNKNEIEINIPLLQQNSSMIGGAHNETTEPFDVVTRRFMGMYVTRLSDGGENTDEVQVQQKVTANFAVTKLSVVVDEAPGDGDVLRFQLRRNGANADLNPDINAQCDVTGSSNMCTSEGCQEFQMGDLIAVSITAATVDGNARIVPTRWNARIVESGTCELLDLENGSSS